jgi:hypothetical protein
MNEWQRWRHDIVAEIRSGFREQFSAIEDQDIDWDAWMPLYTEGCSPQEAVAKAFGHLIRSSAA